MEEIKKKSRKKSKEKPLEEVLPKSKVFSRADVLGVMMFVAASGGYGGWVAGQEFGDYGAFFDERYHRFTEVIDGDTGRTEDGTVVRFLGIDAPEKDGCYAVEAKAELEKLVLGQEVYFDKDMEAVDDRGRLLRYVFIRNPDPERGDVQVNYEMIKKGAAVNLWIAPNRRYQALFTAGQTKARQNEVGLWGECKEELAELVPERQLDIEQPNEECNIKGNVSEKGNGKLYYMEGCSNFGRVKIDPTRGEQWFCSEEEAQEAGFEKSGGCAENGI